jgi:ubiquitin-protein ligase E3 A
MSVLSPRVLSRYEAGYHASHPLIRWFWEVLHEMDFESQRKLLMFATGSMKAPIGGLSNLNLLIQRAGADSNQLPTSHTCFNTILLPEYSSKAKLRERLMTAILECQGFGLK